MFKTESFGKWCKNLPIRTSSKIPDLKSQYALNYVPYKIKETKKAKKEKPTICNLSFLGNTHYRTTFYGIGTSKPLSAKTGYQFHTIPMTMEHNKTAYHDHFEAN